MSIGRAAEPNLVRTARAGALPPGSAHHRTPRHRQPALQPCVPWRVRVHTLTTGIMGCGVCVHAHVLCADVPHGTLDIVVLRMSPSITRVTARAASRRA